jgi:hypothetical protein
VQQIKNHLKKKKKKKKTYKQFFYSPQHVLYEYYSSQVLVDAAVSSEDGIVIK